LLLGAWIADLEFRSLEGDKIIHLRNSCSSFLPFHPSYYSLMLQRRLLFCITMQAHEMMMFHSARSRRGTRLFSGIALRHPG
jgi:hypothetical protein